MFFVKKSNVDINMKFIDKIVKSYFSFLKEENLDVSGSEISEILRHAMCRALCLESKGYSIKVEICATRFYNHTLVNLMDDINIAMVESESRQGLLEACVHCMEMSRKKAKV